MMFVPHGKHTYGPPRLVTGIALLFYMSMMFVPYRKHNYETPRPVTRITLLTLDYILSSYISTYYILQCCYRFWTNSCPTPNRFWNNQWSFCGHHDNFSPQEATPPLQCFLILPPTQPCECTRQKWRQYQWMPDNHMLHGIVQPPLR
jgi:hypothetical protein